MSLRIKQVLRTYVNVLLEEFQSRRVWRTQLHDITARRVCWLFGIDVIQPLQFQRIVLIPHVDIVNPMYRNITATVYNDAIYL